MNPQEELSTIRKQVSFLTRYAIGTTILLGAIALTALVRSFGSNPARTDFEEITVKRINVVEEDGTLRMSVSNKEKSIGGRYRGKPDGIPGDGSRPGLIFYNDEGSEIGGLAFSGNTDPESGDYFQTGHLSFDQYDQNQTVYVQYLDDNGAKKAGLYVDDWQESPPFHEFRLTYKEAEKLPDGPEKEKILKQLMEPRKGQKAFANRVFVGKDLQKSAVVNLSDRMGQVRLQLMVDSSGMARILFLDSEGKISSSLSAQDFAQPVRGR